MPGADGRFVKASMTTEGGAKLRLTPVQHLEDPANRSIATLNWTLGRLAADATMVIWLRYVQPGSIHPGPGKVMVAPKEGVID